MNLLKKSNLLNLMFLLFTICCNKTFQIEKIYGTWESENNGINLIINFKKNNNCEMKFYHEDLKKTELIKGIYNFNYNKNPISLDIKKISNLQNSLYTIVDIVDENSIRIAKFSPKWRQRPIFFNKKNTINLKRRSI